LPSHPDGLTTLALVLAILAFLVQIFVFLFQTNAAAASMQRSEQLNAETHGALNTIEANSAATQKVLFAQFDRLLDYVVGPTTESSNSAESPGDELIDTEDGSDDEEKPATVADVQRIVAELGRQRERPIFTEQPALGTESDENLRVARYLQSWPTREEAEVAVAELKKLPPLALASLTRYGTIEIRQRLANQRIGLTAKAKPELAKIMLAHGLIRREGDRNVLSDHGRALARALPIGKVRGERPDWYDEVLAPLLAFPGGAGG